MRRVALIIDDEPDVATYLATILQDDGWETMVAHSSADGLARARERVPDIVLLDVMMPEKGGMMTLVAIRKDPQLVAVPVVLVTGIQETLRNADFAAYLERAKVFKPDGYLAKPIDPDELRRTVDQLTTTAVF